MITLPCARRQPGQVCVEVRDGKLHSAAWGDEWPIEPGSTLRGWGDLDGPSVRVGGVDVPTSVIEHLRQHHGLTA